MSHVYSIMMFFTVTKIIITVNTPIGILLFIQYMVIKGYENPWGATIQPSMNGTFL